MLFSSVFAFSSCFVCAFVSFLVVSTVFQIMVMFFFQIQICMNRIRYSSVCQFYVCSSLFYGICVITLHLKCYLRYKTITSQNTPSEGQAENFLFRRKVMFQSQEIRRFLFLTIPWFIKSVTLRWVHETSDTRESLHFGIYLLNRNSSSHQNWPIHIN